MRGGIGKPGLVNVGGERHLSLRLWTSGGKDVVKIDAVPIIGGGRIMQNFPDRRSGRCVGLATAPWLLGDEVVVQGV